MKKVATCIVAILTSCVTVHAEDSLNAKGYLAGCRDYLNHEGNVFSGRCVGFVEGVSVLNDTGVFCAPQFATTDQFIRLIVLYVEDRPDRMSEDFRKLAVEALQKSFPCRKNSN
jgi:hypothetical protein